MESSKSTEFTQESTKLVTKALQEFQMVRQPDFKTCGPTSYESVVNYYGLPIDREHPFRGIRMLENDEGTLDSFIGLALLKHCNVKIYVNNMSIFENYWFPTEEEVQEKQQKGWSEKDFLVKCLQDKLSSPEQPELKVAIQGYLDFLKAGGEILHDDLSIELLLQYMQEQKPIIAGIAYNKLYKGFHEPKAHTEHAKACGDNHTGNVGHFVVLCGAKESPKGPMIRVADPLLPNPMSGDSHYCEVHAIRVICATMLGAVTRDGSWIIATPKDCDASPLIGSNGDGKPLSQTPR